MPFAVALAVGAVAASGPAFAHTEVRRSSPSPGEVVVGIVDSVELEFLDPVLPTVEISVRFEDEDQVDDEPVPGSSDVAHTGDGLGASVTFDALTVAGNYIVDYEFVAVDGDAQVDAYRFTLDPSTATDDPGTGDPDGVGKFALGAVAVGVVGALAVAIRRRSGRHG